MMRLVLVNRGHPSLAHVRAIRARGFAHGLARIGHQVVLLTQSTDDSTPPPHTEQLLARLDAHDWSLPFVLPVTPARSPLLSAARDGRMPKHPRKAVLATHFLLHGGVYSDWRIASRPFWPILARHFKPDGTWGTFGDSDALVIAQGVARLAACPWVLDMKDPWRVFIPPPLRSLLASRFADASGFTSLSDQHGREILHWFGASADTIYSDIDPILLPPTGTPPPNAPPTLLMMGSLYSPAHLKRLVEGIGQWAGTLSPQDRASARLIYAGTETAVLLSAARDLPIPVETPGWCDLARLRAMAGNATALLYVRSPQALYQHKGLELAAFDRPILCLPEESEETIRLITGLGVPFQSCATSEAVTQALARFHASQIVPRVNRARLAHYSWDAQAARLAGVFNRLRRDRTAPE